MALGHPPIRIYSDSTFGDLVTVMPHWRQGPRPDSGMASTLRLRPYDAGPRERFLFSSVQSLYVIELKSSLRRRLAYYTHARRMLLHSVENSIARLAFSSADSTIF